MKRIIMFFILILLPFVSVNAEKQIYVDNEIKPKNDINRSAFFVGNTVKNKADVKGISFMVGDKIEDGGAANYAFIAGRDILIESTIENDLFLAGDSVVMRNDAIVGRDIYTFSNSFKISGKINGNINAYTRNITIEDAIISGDVYLVAPTITIKENVVIEGKLSYDENSVIEIDKTSEKNIAKMNTFSNKLNNKDIVINKAKSGFLSFLGMLFIAAVLTYLIPTFPKKINKNFQLSKVPKNIGIGLLLLIVVPIIAIFLIISWFGMPFGFILSILYGLSIYFTTLIVGIILGKYLWTKLFKQAENIWPEMLLGLFTVYILKSFPIMDGLISLLIILFGLGFIFEMVKNSLKKS